MATIRLRGRAAGTLRTMTVAAVAAPLLVLPTPASAADEPCVLPGGTIGIPELEDDLTNDTGPRAVPADDAPADLPDAVHLRGMTETYNRNYWFALHDGSLWFRPNLEVTGVDGGWGRVPTPECLDGRITQISADDDELVALDAERRIHQLDQVLADPALWNWSTRWGNPFWTGDGWNVPAGAAWDWSVVSNKEDETWLDPAGNHHAIGDGKVSHIWLLGEDRQTLTYLDPWLPRDLSYEACGPLRGRFVSEAMVSSGSTLMVVNAYGDIWTRVYDFDIAGADPVFFSYAYEDQRGVSNPRIQLPGAPWVAQPKVPGDITDRISIFKQGTGVTDRTLRIEGRDAEGRTGYWEKPIGLGTEHPWINGESSQVDPIAEGAGTAWTFVPTGAPLRGRLLDNRPDHALSAATTGPSDDRRYRQADVDTSWSGTILDFNLYCTPSTLRVEVGDGSVFDLLLHVTDTIRQSPIHAGLADEPRGARLTVEVPPALWEARADQSPAVQQFLADELDGRWTTTTFDVSLSALDVADLGWHFTHDGSTYVPTDCGELAELCAGLRELSAAMEPLDAVLAPFDEGGRDLEPLVIVLREALAYLEQAATDVAVAGGSCTDLADPIAAVRTAAADVSAAADVLGEVLGDRSRTLRPAVARAIELADLAVVGCPVAAPSDPDPTDDPAGDGDAGGSTDEPEATPDAPDDGDEASLPATGGSQALLGAALVLGVATAGTRRRRGLRT